MSGVDWLDYRIRCVRDGYNRGWSFTPLRGKRPTVKGWQAADRETLGQAIEWAKAGNVGIRTGAGSGGLLVVDLDTNKDDYDENAVAALALPETVTAITGSGGVHLFYVLPDGVSLGNSAGKLAPCVDTRGDGGQIVFAGSMHPDTKKAYAWKEGGEPWNIELVELPAAFVEILLGNSVEPADADRGGPGGVDGAGQDQPALRKNTPKTSAVETPSEKYARRALADEMATVANAAEGTRNGTLNSSAYSLGQLVGGGVLNREAVERGLLGAALSAGLGKPESTATINSGLEKGISEPRGVPERPQASSYQNTGSQDGRRATNAGPGIAETARLGGHEIDRSGEDFVRLGLLDPKSERLVLSAKKTLPTAEAYVREFASHADGRTLHSYGGVLTAWRDNRYIEAEDGEIKNRLQPWLHRALQNESINGKAELRGFCSNPRTVNNALETIRAFCHVPQRREVPFWLSGNASRANPSEVLPCKSVNLHIPTGEVTPATPDLFTYNALDFDYDADAPLPANWLDFLDSLWPNDPDSILLLQEWFGYCLTLDTSQQKMLLLIGPKRSGKGTIGRVLTELVGRENVAGPTVGSLAGQFGLEPLLGKSLALVSDARFVGASIQSVVERLLVISGEDTITIDRKHIRSITQKLACRFAFLSNELPRFRDSAGALAGRFVILTLRQSFFGREDRGLTKRLLGELPGILRWALDGWLSLHDRGRFDIPKSSQENVEMLNELSSPVSVFVNERCEVGEDKTVFVSDLYEAWKAWNEKEGTKYVSTRQGFGRELYAAVPGLQKPSRNHKTGRFYRGIALRDSAENTLPTGGDDSPDSSDSTDPPENSKGE